MIRYGMIFDQIISWRFYTMKKIKTYTLIIVLFCGLWGLFPMLNLASGEPNRWFYEDADIFLYNGQDNSMALDSQGYPHMAYYNPYSTWDELIYVFWNGTAWTREVAASDGDVGHYASLVLDENDQPHIAHANWTGPSQLLYSFRNSSGWFTEIVDTGTSVGTHCSLALYNGNPYISYADSTIPIRDLMFAYKEDGVWQTEVVDDGGSYADHVGGHSSLAFDAMGTPHISYCKWDSDETSRQYDDLKYAFHNGTGWEVETVDTGGTFGRVGEYTSLKIDSTGHPHISYFDMVNGDLKYAYLTGTGWEIEIALAGGGAHTCLALDPNDNAHISHFSGGLKYTYKLGGIWYSEQVLGSGTGQYSAIALDTMGYVHLSCQDVNIAGGDLKYARSKNPLIIYPQMQLTDEFFSKDNITYTYRMVEQFSQAPISNANVTVWFNGSQFSATDKGVGYYEAVLPYSSIPEVCQVTIEKLGIITKTFSYDVYVDPPAVEKEPETEPEPETVPGFPIIVIIGCVGITSLILFQITKKATK